MCIVHMHCLTYDPRLLDDMKDDSACRVLVQEKILPHDFEVIDVQDYAHDADEFGCAECVSQMTLCMEAGRPVLLRNCSSGRLLCSFYNLFNQNFRVTETAEGLQTLYIIIAHGARVHHCRVHPNFFVVLQMQKEDFLEQPAALRSRFSVVTLPLEEVLQERLQVSFVREAQRKSMRSALETVWKLVGTLGEKAIVGLVDQTLVSLLLSMVESLRSSKNSMQEFASLCSDGLELNASTAVQVMAVRLLQLMPPEQMLHHAEKFGQADFYRRAYFSHQSHFSLMGVLTTARNNKLLPLPKLVLYTRSSAEICSLLQRGEHSLGSLSIIDASEVATTQALEAKYKASQGKQDRKMNGAKKNVLLVVDMEHHQNQHVSWLRAFVDLKARDSADTLWVILLHYPPEQVISGKLYPCVFLDGWDFFFIDSLTPASAFDEEYLLRQVICGSPSEGRPQELDIVRPDESRQKYVVDFCRRVHLPQTHAQAPGRYSSMEHRETCAVQESKESTGLLTSLAAWMGRGVGLLLGKMGPADDDNEAAQVAQAVDTFYAKDATVQQRVEGVLLVLQRHPRIWQHLIATFHENFSGPKLLAEVTQLASQIRKGRKLMSFVDAVRLHLHGEFQQHVAHYLKALCSHGGLRDLVSGDATVAMALLPLLPVCSRSGQHAESWVAL